MPMEHWIRALAVCAVLLQLGSCGGREPEQPADLVILGADIRTMDSGHPQATALAVRGGKIAYVGDDAGARRLTGSETEVLRLKGVTVLPGLIDSHIHASDGALGLGGCSLEDAELDIAAAAAVIRECLEEHAISKWLVVGEVNSAGFRADRKALDAIV